MERCEKATKSITLYASHRGIQHPKVCLLAGCDQTEVTQQVCVNNGPNTPVTDKQMNAALSQWRRITRLEDNNFIPFRYYTYTYFVDAAGALGQPDVSVWK